MHTGTINGGTQLNIVPRDCSFEFEFRHLPNEDPQALLAEVRSFAEAQLLPEMQSVAKDTGFSWDEMSAMPSFDTAEEADVVQLAMKLTGANTTGKVSFGTEAGLFEKSGIQAVVCGPGSIEVAHKPNEYITLDQVALGERFLQGVIERCKGK